MAMEFHNRSRGTPSCPVGVSVPLARADAFNVWCGEPAVPLLQQHTRIQDKK
jgi:hypothetical protein